MKKHLIYIIVSLSWAVAAGVIFAQDSVKEVRSMAVFEGRFWGATGLGAGLVRFESGAWKPAPEAATGLPNAPVTALAAVHGRLYAGTASGLSVWNGSAWAPVPLPVSGTIGVTALAADGGALAISTPAGLFRIEAAGGSARLYIAPDPQTAAVSVSGVSVSNVRVFPLPGDGAARAGGIQPSAVATAREGTTEPAKEPSWWTKVKKPGRPQPGFFKDILPVMVKECMPCHTDGTGKYFPLNDPQTVIRYFRQGGLVRFEQFLEEGGGMAGKVSPQTAKLIHVWAVDGCRE